MHKKIPLGTTDYYESERTSLKVSFIVVLLLMVWGLVFRVHSKTQKTRIQITLRDSSDWRYEDPFCLL